MKSVPKKRFLTNQKYSIYLGRYFLKGITKCMHIHSSNFVLDFYSGLFLATTMTTAANLMIMESLVTEPEFSGFNSFSGVVKNFALE